MLTASAKRTLVTKAVVAMFHDFYRSPPLDVLDTDPNDLDLDPAPFYEMIVEEFGIAFDDSSQEFGGLGGTLADSIAYVSKRWKLQKLPAIKKRAAQKVAKSPKPAATKAGSIAWKGPPAIEKGWRIVEVDQLPKRVKSPFTWNKAKAALFITPAQKKDFVDGEDLLKTLKAKAVLTAHVHDWLLEHQDQIPIAWRRFEAICFWGTIFRDQNDEKCIRSLLWVDTHWITTPTGVWDTFDKTHPAATG